MNYWQLHYIIQQQQEDELQTQFVLKDFINYVISSRNDGLLDVLLFSSDANEIADLKQMMDAGSFDFVSEQTFDELEMLAQFNPQAPIALADDLTVYPCDPPPETGDIILHIPAGPAFGDGRHPTTQMLARYLMKCDCAQKHILDLGCGTGLLGLVAKRRGAACVDFTDYDADAVRFTKDMCALNHYPEAAVWESNLLEQVDKTYDIIVANIYADLLLDVLDDPQLKTNLPSGLLLLSGISFKRIDEVLAAAQKAGFTVIHQEEQAWWHCLVLKR